MALHKLKTDPRTLPSRNQDDKASRGSAARNAEIKGVEGENIYGLATSASVAAGSSLAEQKDVFSLRLYKGWRSGRYPMIATLLFFPPSFK